MIFSRFVSSKMGRKIMLFVLMACVAALGCVAAYKILLLTDADPVFAEFGPSVMYTTPSGDPGPGALYGRALRTAAFRLRKRHHASHV